MTNDHPTLSRRAKLNRTFQTNTRFQQKGNDICRGQLALADRMWYPSFNFRNVIYHRLELGSIEFTAGSVISDQ